jgi:predicted RNA-binding Zn ribbon-like protein
VTFAHDTISALTAAAALVNSAGDPDTMTTVAQLDDFYRAHGYSGRHDRDPAELAAVRELRAPLRTVLTAPRDTAVALVNAMLAEAGALPQLVRHDEWDWHLHVVGPERPLSTRIAVETAIAVVDLIRADELGRVSVCAAEGCDGIVADLSRNRSRRFCRPACGNRVAVAAYRARRAGS